MGYLKVSQNQYGILTKILEKNYKIIIFKIKITSHIN